MKTFKIIIGAILGIASLVTIVQVAGEESGASLFGAFIGFVLLGGLSVWLIYSGLKK
jgi:hypothetical protein